LRRRIILNSSAFEKVFMQFFNNSLKLAFLVPYRYLEIEQFIFRPKQD